MITERKRFNKIIIILTLSDVLVWGTYLIAAPLQGIYLTYSYGDKSIQYVAIGLSIYYVMRAVFQVPIGFIVDRTRKDFDEIWALGIGSALMGLNFILFPLTNEPYQYYLIMALGGVGASFNLIGWRKLFAKNLDKDKEGREYATYETVMSLCTAVFCFFGGELSSISHEVFRAFFFVIGGATALGGIVITLVLIQVKKDEYKDKITDRNLAK